MHGSETNNKVTSYVTNSIKLYSDIYGKFLHTNDQILTCRFMTKKVRKFPMIPKVPIKKGKITV